LDEESSFSEFAENNNDIPIISDSESHEESVVENDPMTISSPKIIEVSSNSFESYVSTPQPLEVFIISNDI